MKTTQYIDTFRSHGKYFDLASIEKSGELTYWPADGRPYKNHANRNLKIAISVVSLFGNMGYAVIIPFTEDWLGKIIHKSDVSKQLDFMAEGMTDFAKMLNEAVTEECGAHKNQSEILTGINTRPDGHELIFFVDWNDPELLRIIYQYVSGNVYDMAKGFLEPVLSVKPKPQPELELEPEKGTEEEATD